MYFLAARMAAFAGYDKTLQPDKGNEPADLNARVTILRVAETIAVGLGFSKALGWDPETTRLGFAFRWTKLAGRELSAWGRSGGSSWTHVSSGHIARDDEKTTFVEVAATTPMSAIAPLVQEATNGFFTAFRGYALPAETIEHWVQRLIERRLSS